MQPPANQPTATLATLYCDTAEAMRLLCYQSRTTFYAHLQAGWIAGAQRRGTGPKARYYFRVSELDYVGPGSAAHDAAQGQPAAVAGADPDDPRTWAPQFTRQPRVPSAPSSHSRAS